MSPIAASDAAAATEFLLYREETLPLVDTDDLALPYLLELPLREFTKLVRVVRLFDKVVFLTGSIAFNFNNFSYYYSLLIYLLIQIFRC